jgi:hypothetical protein
MNKLLKNLLMCGATMCGLAMMASAQDAVTPPLSATPPASGATTVVLYGGQPVSASQVKIAAWGGGTVKDQEGEAFTTAGHTIEIDTAGMYQGGQIQFPTPISLGDLKKDSSRYLQIVFSVAPTSNPKFQKPAAPAATTTTPGQPGMPPGFRPGMMPPGMGFPGRQGMPDTSYHYSFGPYVEIAQGPPSAAQIQQMIAAQRAAQAQAAAMQARMGGRQGQRGFMPPNIGPMGPMGPMGPTTPAADQTSAPPPLPISNLHVVLQFADGDQVELMRPVVANVGDDVNWLRVSVPLSKIPVDEKEAADAQLSDIYIGSDSPATVSVGEVLTVTDHTPLTANAGSAQTVPTNSAVSFVGEGEGGASMLAYDWNFDSPNHFVSEAQGNYVSHTFTKAGDYVVTLKVSDVDDLKPAVTSTVTIHVTDQ